MFLSRLAGVIIVLSTCFFSVLPAQHPVPSEEEFLQFIEKNGVTKAVELFYQVKQDDQKAKLFDEKAMNQLGYRYLNSGKLAEAIELFKLNTVAYPDAYNTYDSLGEAYMTAGNIKLAIANYNKSTELNPDNPQAAGIAYTLNNYKKAEYDIPMRDGIKLYTQVYAPKDTSRSYPFLLFRTPYSIRFYPKHNYRGELGPNDLYAREGYIFVYQDVRGKFRSEGEFVVMRPHITVKKGPQDTDESSDTYDTIEWLLKNVSHHNGRAGQWGISYPGFQTVMGMIDAHPALKASSPQASPADMWIGDDFHHNGAFRLMYTFGWLSNNARNRPGSTEAARAPFDYGTPDGYRFFLDLGPLSNVDERYFHQQVPTWNEYMTHGNYDHYWQVQEVTQNLDHITHPVLNVAGWFDAEDFYGPMQIYYRLEEKNPTNKSTLVVGPWLHGGWNRTDGDFLGEIDFGQKTGSFFQEKIEFAFFNYYLKDKGTYSPDEAIVFETGSNQWRAYDHWPPKQTTQSNLYLINHRQLSFSPPTESTDNAADSFISDPGKPVPWSSEIRTNQGHLWMIEDQRFAARRPDVLVYQSDVLDKEITIAGPIIANLFVSSSGTDADWIVKLIDVFPGNAPANRNALPMGDFQMLIGAEVFRSKYRNSFEHPHPLVPAQITEIKYDLRDKYHCFKKDHRIMVQIQSTWFPVIDRNPQKFINIYQAVEDDFQKATHTVYHSEKYPSHLEIYLLD
jgi:putative CocE/NonD family hydrolase